MTKSLLITHVTKIFDMSHTELNDQAVAISMSDLDDKAKYYLNTAIDMRRGELEGRDITTALVVGAEIDPSGF